MIALQEYFADSVARHVTMLRLRGPKATGCCPFHEDANPSFSADLEKGVFYCFGCGVQGGMKAFLERVGEPWISPRSPFSKRERRRFAAAAHRRDAEQQARRIISRNIDLRYDELAARHRDLYTTLGWATDRLRIFRRWPTLALEFPELLRQSEREYGEAQDALAVLTAQLDETGKIA